MSSIADWIMACTWGGLPSSSCGWCSGWRWPGGHRSGRADEPFRHVGRIALLAAAVAGWSVVSARRPSLVTLPALMSRIDVFGLLRLLVVIVWAWLGWHLFAREAGRSSDLHGALADQ